MKRAAVCLRMLVILCCLTACIPFSGSLVPPPTSAFEGWQTADLRYLQAPNADTQHSLIAVYQRQADLDLEIRLDLLELAQPVDFDLYLLFDTRPGGTMQLPALGIQAGLAYDVLLKIPAGGPPTAWDEYNQPLRHLIPRTVNHPGLGIVTVAFNRTALPGSLSQGGLQVFLTEAGKPTILSQTPPIFSTQPHPKPAPLLLVFWDSLPAITPAQTLRRWEGAHTGPLGGRHGLSVLLQAAHAHKIPLVLADLLQPASLAGVNAAGGLPRLREAAWSGDVMLPEPAFGDPHAWQVSQSMSHHAALNAGLPAGGAAFGTFTPPLPEAYATFFADLADRSRMLIWQGKRLVPLPEAVYRTRAEPAESQLTQAGLSLAVRQALLAAALSDDPARLVVLGGSLPESAWGDLSAAPAAFEYIAAHPWISPLRAADLQIFPAALTTTSPLPVNCRDLLCSPAVQEIIPVTGSGQPAPSAITLPRLRQELRQQLENLPAGPFTPSAWQSYLALTAPTTDLRLVGLQANALGQVGYLVEAARWNLRPISATDCNVDLDFDGLPECVLTSETWLAVIKPEGGRLVFAAQRNPQTAVQWVGAASQFAVGLSDPSEWQPQLGPAGDPGDIPGAFAPPGGPYELFTTQILHPGQVTLRSPDNSEMRSFAISGAEFQVEIQSTTLQSLRIPITLPAGARSPAPQWAGNQWVWQPPNGPGLCITVQGAETLTSSSYLDTVEAMTVQENPNRAYPRGHYLPYPLAVVEAQGSRVSFRFTVQ